jgi:ferric-dicitrate binding protein FerR (iron transport regulator)
MKILVVDDSTINNILLQSFLEEEKGFVEDLKKVDVEKNWRRFLQSAGQESPLLRIHPFGRKLRFITRIAAAALLLLAATATLYFTAKRPAHQLIQAKAGLHNMEISLSDGTVITLNEGAVLTYPEKLNRRSREVALDGEAYFQVERAEKSPFYIYIGDRTVKVVGTSFNLRKDASGSIELSVVHGEVLFYETGDQDEAIRVMAGQRCVFIHATGELSTSSIQSDNYLFWKTRKLIYRDESLSSVFEDLEILFKQRIIVSDPNILQKRWNSTHEGQKLNEILDELCLYFDLEYIQKNDTILIHRK